MAAAVPAAPNLHGGLDQHRMMALGRLILKTAPVTARFGAIPLRTEPQPNASGLEKLTEPAIMAIDGNTGGTVFIHRSDLCWEVMTKF